MAERKEVLTDLQEGIWLDHYRLSTDDGPKLAGSSDWRVDKRTMRGGVSEGVDLIRLNNGALSLELVPTRGLGLWRGDYHGIPLGWNSPVRYPVHPSFVNTVDLQGLGWLTGFNEWMCRCGLSSLGGPGLDVVENEDGLRSETPVTLHGRIANTPCHHVSVGVDDNGPGTLWVRGEMDEAWLFGPKLRLASTISTDADSNAFSICDEVTNVGNEPGELQLMYHTNLGPPLLEQGSRLVAAAREVAPYDAHSANAIENWTTFNAPSPGFVQQCYFIEPLADESGTVSVMLCNQAEDKGLGISFNNRELPCFTLWKNMQGEADGYVTGLEPGTSFPNLKSFERNQGRVISLPPGKSYRTSLRIEVYDTAAQVSTTTQKIMQQATAPPTLHRELHPQFAPVAEPQP